MKKDEKVQVTVSSRVLNKADVVQASLISANRLFRRNESEQIAIMNLAGM